MCKWKRDVQEPRNKLEVVVEGPEGRRRTVAQSRSHRRKTLHVTMWTIPEVTETADIVRIVNERPTTKDSGASFPESAETHFKPRFTTKPASLPLEAGLNRGSIRCSRRPRNHRFLPSKEPPDLFSKPHPGFGDKVKSLLLDACRHSRLKTIACTFAGLWTKLAGSAPSWRSQ